MTPRPYFSWSQFNLFGRSEESFRKTYVYGYKFNTPHTAFGREFALMREKREYPDDYTNIMLFLQQYPKREYVMTAYTIIDKKKVMLLARPDGIDFRRHIIGDDKTGLATHITEKGNISKEWDQKKADKCEQLTFDALVYWKKKRVIPRLRIHWIETKKLKNGVIVATGRVETFETTRTMKDLIVLNVKINQRWRGIIKLYEAEWKKVF